MTILDYINCVANAIAALGTVGATITALVLAYSDTRKRISPSLRPLYKTVPSTLKTFEVVLQNKSNYDITVNAISIGFHFSTANKTYNQTFPLSADSLEVTGDKMKYPFTVKSRTIKHLYLVNGDSDEIIASIASFSSEASKSSVRIEIEDESGRTSYSKWVEIR